MFKQSLTASTEVVRIYNNEKCIHPQPPSLLFSPPTKRHREKRSCICRLGRGRYVSHSTWASKSGKKNNTPNSEKPRLCGVGTERWRKSNCRHQEGRLMMIDKHWLYLTPTHDYGVFIYPPVALSPSALFGSSEEACRRSTRCSCDFDLVIRTKLTSPFRRFKFSSY